MNARKLSVQTTLGERIRQVVDLSGLNQRSFAEKLPTDPTQFSRWLNNKVVPELESLVLIHNLSGCGLDWLLTGKGPMRRDSSLTPVEDGDTVSSEFVSIPCVRGEVSAGAGRIPDETIEMRIAFRRDWIQRKGDPRNMSIIRVKGDSMEPTLQSGDLVLIDHNHNHLDPSGGIYAIAVNDHIMLKRIQFFPRQNRVKIISDNAARYEAEEHPADEVNINGKVIWFGREIER